MEKFLLNGLVNIPVFYTFVFLLYFLQLSTLYRITPFYFIYCTLVLLTFISVYYIFNTFSKNNLNRLIKTVKKKENIFEIYYSKSKNIRLITFIFLLIGLFGTILKFKLTGVIAFQQSKLMRLDEGGLAHYLGYMRAFLSFYILMAYFIIRSKSSVISKIFHSIFILVSFILLGLNLNRGDFTFPFLGILFLELINSINKNKLSRFFMIAISSAVVMAIIFDYFGNLRVEYVMERVYHHSLAEHYGMKGYPSWFVWPYIYSTSPLENFRHIIEDQEIKTYSFGLNLFYPFFQLPLKIIGENITYFIDSDVFPYLVKNAGLNASSFLMPSLMDFSYFGIFIYIPTYTFLVYLGLKFSSYNIYGLMTYIMSINMMLWCVFVNPIAIGPFVIGFIIFLILAIRMRNSDYSYPKPSAG